MIQQNKDLGALLSWALRNGFCAHVSTEGDHIIVLAKADRQTTRIAHLRDQQPAAAALLINNPRTHVLRPVTVAAHYYGDVPGVARFLRGLSLIDTTLNTHPYAPPKSMAQIHSTSPKQKRRTCVSSAHQTISAWSTEDDSRGL